MKWIHQEATGNFSTSTDSSCLALYVTYLKDLLYTTGHIVVLGSHNVGVHNTGGGIQGVHSRVDTQLSNGTGQHGGGIQVGKGGGRGRVSQVISRHIDGLKYIGKSSSNPIKCYLFLNKLFLKCSYKPVQM